MRIVLGLEYNGKNYHGWQKQENLPTVQFYLEKALSKVADHKIKVICAGRTDIGVHAKEQIVHFDTEAQRATNAWVLGGNSNLPRDITILWAKNSDASFHARFSAKARSYRYLIYNNPAHPAILSNLVTWHIAHLNEEKMNEAGQYLLGENDFSSFRGSGCQSKTPMRNVNHISVTRKRKVITIDIKANAFLLHMVRNIVGVLIVIGEGKKAPIWAKEVLSAKDRKVAATTAKPDGLYLFKIYY